MMRLPIVVAMTLGLASCGLGGPAYDETTRPDVRGVDMTTPLTFAPDRLEVRAGETVEWRNVSLVEHTTTADPDRAADPSHVALPPGASRFDSGPVPPGEIYRHTFTVPGTYRYVCLPHEGMGMLGTIVVSDRP